MDLESKYNYFLGLINSSLNVTTKNEINQNLYSILNPFYANLVNNTKINTTINNRVNNQVISRQQRQPQLKKPQFNIDNIVFNSHPGEINKNISGSLVELLRPHNIKEKQDHFQSNTEQTIKIQNLNKILNKIHSIKETTGNNGNRAQNLVQNPAISAQAISNTGQNYPNQRQNVTKRSELPIITQNNLNLNKDKTNNEIAVKKTVRQLLEERQSFIEKLKENQLEIMKCHINTMKPSKSTGQVKIPVNHNVIKLGTHGHVTASMSRHQIPEMIAIRSDTNKNGVDLTMGDNIQISPGHGLDQAHYNQNSTAFQRTCDIQVNKGLTVRQLLERQRNTNQTKQRNRNKVTRIKRNQTTFHPYIRTKQDITKEQQNGLQQKKSFFTDLGMNANNPILLSDEESETSLLKSCSSSVMTENSIDSEYSAHCFNDYDFRSEHNYVLDPDLNSIKNIETVDETEKMNEIFSLEQKEMMIDDLNRNHEQVQDNDFARCLNLIKSRDLKNNSIAYWNGKFPINDIAKSVYAGLETKNAILDFPKSTTQMNRQKQLKISKNKILDYRNENKSDLKKIISDNWTQILDNLDFTSPLSQKIIKIFPKYQSENLQIKALKVKPISK